MTNEKKTKLETVLIPKAREIAKMLDDGVSEKEIAARVGVSYTTWKNYKKELKEYLQNGRDESRSQRLKDVENAIYESAVGIYKTVKKGMKVKRIEYEDGRKKVEEERIEYYFEDLYFPPSVSAGQFLLKNWDKQNYSNNPAELDQKKEEFNHKIKEEW